MKTAARPAVVTDARLRMAVNIIRSLGRAGVPVTAVEAAGASNILGFYSRYAARRTILARDASGRFRVDDLLAVGGEGAVIVPVSTEMVALLAEQAGRTAAAPGAAALPLTLVPPLAALRKLHDKTECLRLGRSLGIPTPETHVPTEEGVTPADSRELERWARHLRYPVILKYRSGEDYGLPAAERYRVCRSASEVAARYPGMHAVQRDPLVQEYVVTGADVGVALLYDRNSRPAASFTYRSLRQRPKAGGPTTMAESVWLPELVEYAERLLGGLGWRGMAMVDFKEDSRGSFRLLEVNPRFWGSLQLAIVAGVDFPRLYYAAALDVTEEEVFGGSAAARPRPGRPRQREGVRVRFFPHDFLSVLEYARDPAARGGRSRLDYVTRASVELLSPGLADGLFSLSDVKPGLAYLVGGVLKGRRHGL